MRTPTLPLRLLILGGTAEASALAQALAGDAAVAPVLSLAGRTAAPVRPPVPYRVGGFGGAEGFARYLAETAVDAVVDATHPFAARISATAAAVCTGRGVPRATFTRTPWMPRPGDRWRGVPDLDAAAAALGPVPRRVFLTTGRLGLAAFKAAPQHRYLIRTIDPPAAADLPPTHDLVFGRGPFAAEEERALMRRAGTQVLVTKNSGGAAGEAKLTAARALDLPVIVVEPPRPAAGRVFTALPEVLDWLAGHRAAP